MKTNLPVVKSKRIILREITLDDYLDYFFIGSSVSTTKYLTWGPFEEPKDAYHMLYKFYIHRQDVGLPPAYAICDKRSGEMIGLIEYHTYLPMQNCAELGFLLREDWQGIGIMKEALDIMIDLGFNYLDLDKIVVGHVDLNINCKKLIAKCGFKYEYSKYGGFTTKDTQEVRNILYYSMYKNEYERKF